MFTFPPKKRPPVLICISDTRACYWIVLTQLIIGIFLLIYQSQAVFMNHRGIGIWWETILLADVFIDFISAASALGGYESSVESTMYPILFTKTFRFCFYCAILSTILLMDCYSNKSEFFLEHVVSEFELLCKDKQHSLQIADNLSVVLLMSLIIYPINCAVNVPPSTRAIIFMIYLPLSMVFQGLSAAIVWRRIAEIRRTELDRSVRDWVPERSVQRAERSSREESKTSTSDRSVKRMEKSDRKASSSWMSKRSTKRAERLAEGESSRVGWTFLTPTKNKRQRCACCPDFEFGCLQKVEVIAEDEDDYD